MRGRRLDEDFVEHPEIQRQRLEGIYQGASTHAAKLNDQAVQVSVEIGREKTQYFEKLTYGCGGAVTLIVSFVGAHAGRLRPPYLLRSALITLVLAMMCGFYRNWKFPWYVLGAWAARDSFAKLERERARKDIICTGRATASEDGKPIDPQKWLVDFGLLEAKLTDQIKIAKKQEESAFNWTRRAEYTMLCLAGLGMVQLVVLAWLNF
jgi:hypothetical protein